MKKYKESHLRFLHDFTIPTTNNAAERYLRNYKRKQKQAISFRSFASIEDLCDGKSMLIKIRKTDGANVFQEVACRFDS
ncbi:IS66 family transposase [Oribacterium sp. HCP28S3_H8]|uniref:IS66 family transposase n=1 Tax=Oribacterium sp. HCP28S3_H8 TaxID=3438945 RepID=UPI003F8C278C